MCDVRTTQGQQLPGEADYSFNAFNASGSRGSQYCYSGKSQKQSGGILISPLSRNKKRRFI